MSARNLGFSYDLHALVTIQAETLRSVTACTCGIVTTSRQGVSQNPVIGMNTERPAHAVMTLQAVFFFVTLAAIGLVTLGGHFVVLQILIIMGVVTEMAGWFQFARPKGGEQLATLTC